MASVDRGLDEGLLLETKFCLLSLEGGGGNLFRVLPASELRWVGTGWLCSAV